MKNVKFELGRDGSQSNGTNLIFEAHHDGEVEDTILFSGEVANEDLIVVKNLDPGEAVVFHLL